MKVGTPIEEIIIIPGDDCVNCWGPIQTWAPPTPKFVTMSFHDWTEGRFWHEPFRQQFNSQVILEQDPFKPCLYVGSTTDFDWIWELWGNRTDMIILEKFPGFGWALESSGLPICSKVMDHEPGIMNEWYTAGGYGSIIFGS